MIPVLASCGYFDPLNPYGRTDTSVTWQVHLGGSGEDVACSVQQTADGGYILTGYTNSFGAGGFDLWLVKTDSSGGEEWSKTFGAAADDFGYSGRRSPDGGYILAGSTKSFGAGGEDVYLIKTNAEGKQEWYKTFGGNAGDCGYSVQCTSDGGYIIAGYTFSFGAGGGDLYLIKTNSSGDMLWSNTFGESNYQEQGFCVRQTADEGYVMVGTSTDLSNPTDTNVCLLKTYANGSQEWYRTFGGKDLDGGTGVQQTSDGGYILCGYTRSFGSGDFNAWLIKTDAYGVRRWDSLFGGGAWDQANAVQQTSDGGYILAGMTRSDVPWEQAWLIKTDSYDRKEWSMDFGGEGDDWGLSVQQTADRGYILAGKTNSFGVGDMDAYLIYYKP